MARRVLYFAASDNWKFAQILAKRFKTDFFAAVQATASSTAFFTALTKHAPVDLLIIGTHGADASFLLIDGHEDNGSANSDVSYVNERNPDGINIHPADFGRMIAPHLASGAKTSLVSCSVAETSTGKTFAMALSCTSGSTVVAADNTVSVEVAGSETANVKVVGGDAWVTTNGEYPVAVNKRGRFPYD